MKRFIGLLCAIPILVYLVWRTSAFLYPETREERTLGIRPQLERHADMLSVLSKLGKLESEEASEMIDPWGEPIRVEYQRGLLIVISTGPDKTLDTQDDIRVERQIK